MIKVSKNKFTLVTAKKDLSVNKYEVENLKYFAIVVKKADINSRVFKKPPIRILYVQKKKSLEIYTDKGYEILYIEKYRVADHSFQLLNIYINLMALTANYENFNSVKDSVEHSYLIGYTLDYIFKFVPDVKNTVLNNFYKLNRRASNLYYIVNEMKNLL